MKKITIFILLVSFSATRCFAQNDLLDVKVIPNPGDISAYMGKQDYRSVKQRIKLQGVGSPYNKKGDALEIRNYDKAGRETRVILFSKGKRDGITTYEYPAGQHVTLEHMKLSPSDPVTNFRITYDEQGRKLSVSHSQTSQGYTYKGMVNYDYKDGLLLQREAFLNEKRTVFYTYQYKGTDMVQAEAKNSGPSFTRYVFQYNSDHLPASETIFYVRPNKTDAMPPSTYTYKDKKLVGESIYTNDALKMQIDVTYGYDTLGRISNKSEIKEKSYRNITYEYSGPYISKMIIKTNTGPMGAHDPMMHTFPFGQIPDEIDYYYDNKGYLIKTEEKLNDSVQFSVEYKNSYY